MNNYRPCPEVGHPPESKRRLGSMTILRALTAWFVSQLSLGSRIRRRYLISELNTRVIPLMLGRVKVGIMHLQVKRFDSVLKGLIDNPKSSHQSSTIDSAKFSLSDSVCGNVNVVDVSYGVITRGFKRKLTARFQRSGDRTPPCSVEPILNLSSRQ